MEYNFHRCVNGPVSSGIGILEMPSGVSPKFKFDVPLSSESAELAGIKIACDISHKSKYKNVVIICDCLGAISLINNKKSEAYVIQEIHNTIENSDVEKLELVCVPGHKGININEKTDLIAKSAVNERKPIDSKLDVKDALEEIKKLLELE